MKSVIETRRIVSMELSEEEARWLKELVQNPIGVAKQADEPEHDRLIRERFWYAVKGIDTNVNRTR